MLTKLYELNYNNCIEYIEIIKVGKAPDTLCKENLRCRIRRPANSLVN